MSQQAAFGQRQTLKCELSSFHQNIQQKKTFPFLTRMGRRTPPPQKKYTFRGMILTILTNLVLKLINAFILLTHSLRVGTALLIIITFCFAGTIMRQQAEIVS